MRKGFSLVELSVVIAILGLLVGGVLAGRALMKGAQIKAVATEADKFITGAKMFRQKYEELPGDFVNAEAIWGTAHATDATCISTASTGKETCNGNGNGTLTSVSVRSNEIFRFWQHLANAGFIEGKFSGISEGSNEYSVSKRNVPASEVQAGAWFLYSWASFFGSASFFDGAYLNTLILGKGWPANNWPSTTLLSPRQTESIDSKIDDGKPARGRLTVYNWMNCTTAASSADLNAAYKLTEKADACVLLWPNAFRR